MGLLKSSLARMAGQNVLDDELIGLNFWANWPKKFREAKRYEKGRLLPVKPPTIRTEDVVKAVS